MGPWLALVTVLSTPGFFPSRAQDFGDAPSPYPTFLQQNGPWHPIGGPYFGITVDEEGDGQPDPNALGDDSQPAGKLDDEDGITFLTPLVPGQVATVQIVIGGSGFSTAVVDAWIDFQLDGSWAEPIDRIFSGLSLPVGTHVREFIVPREAKEGPSFARFRVSTRGSSVPTGQAPNGEVEDHQVYLGATTDFGDAPGKYPTLLASNGARHQVSPGFFLGTRVDAESDGQPTADALGDDLNPTAAPDDEDGVIFLTPVVPGQTARVRVILTAPQNPNGGPGTGRLNAWVDFNGNESWADPGEQIFTNVVLTAGIGVPGTNDLSFVVPASAVPGVGFARFRLNREGGLGVGGPAADGEVEDYNITVEAQLDFGDAPGKYPTLLASNGARHQVSPGFFLGTRVDAESDGQPTADALGDDLNPTTAPDDEDGVIFLTPVVPGQTARVRVILTAPQSITGGPGTGRLNAWVDFNGNESWADPGEQIFTNVVLTAGIGVPGTNDLSFAVPASAVPGVTFARFRLNREGGLGVGGPAADGEVEDYKISIESQLDFGDAPEPYPTRLAQNGARHSTFRDTFLGARVDVESDGQPSGGSDGDDLNPLQGPNDEDGVTMLSPLVPGRTASVQVTASRPGRLYAWIDFNRNGSWADPEDRVFNGVSLTTGANTLTFPVPAQALTGRTYSRWRFTVQGPDLSFTGAAPDGEVEDHLLSIIPDRERCDLGCEGREFWLTFPGNYAPDPTNPPQPMLCIQGPAGTVGTVSIAALGYVTNFVIPTNFTAWVLLPRHADLGDLNDTVAPGRAVRVVASADVRVTAFNHARQTTDSYQALHTSTLGTGYVVLAWPNLQTGVPPLNGSQFAIVGTESNTVVLITPSATSAIRPPGVTYAVVLQPGDVYQLRDTNDAPADLTGTIIRSDKPVAVFAGHACATIPTSNQWFCDTVVEQLLPVNTWGSEFYVAPLATRSGGDVIRVLAAHDNTTVSVNGVAVTNLNRGQVLQGFVTTRFGLSASRPVLVAQYATSSDRDGNINADPFMLLLQATRHFSRAYILCTPTNDFPTNYVQIVAPTSVTNNLLLDGVAVNPALFQTVPGSGYAVANVPIGVGHHILVAAAPFGIATYGWALYDSYGHPGCFYFGDVAPPRVTPPVTRLTANVNDYPNTPGLVPAPNLAAATQASDNCQPELPSPSQDPKPASLLPVGQHTLRISTTDNNGNTGEAEVLFTVVDPSPVTIVCPRDIVVPCTTTNGAVVEFTVRAFTTYETNVAVVSTPPSGSLFPVGTTIVTNVATSLAGNTATCTFKVTVVCERRVTVQRTQEGLVLSWPAGGVLEQAPSVTGPWQPVPNATSPYTVRITHQRLFYRVRY